MVNVTLISKKYIFKNVNILPHERVLENCN